MAQIEYDLGAVNAELPKYSLTDEIPVGVWVDGKTIYRKCFHILKSEIAKPVSGNGTTITNYIINDIDTLVNIYGNMKDSAGTRRPIPFSWTGSNSWMIYASISMDNKVKLEYG